MFQLIAYLKFLLYSKNEHGVHSPFVYTLVTKCFYDRTNFPAYSKLKTHRERLLDNKNTIEVSDFGAGSRVFKSNTRAIAKIVKTAGITPKNAKLLFRIVNYFKPTTILEIGTSLGLATTSMALGNPKSTIFTLEGCAATQNIAQENAQENFDRKVPIHFINTKFETYFNQQESELKPATFDLIYFDGNHSKVATLDYFEALISTILPNSIWIFDDIHWSKEMEEAWEILKQHPKVTLTIDTFQWGIVFFRSEHQKEHIVISSTKTFSSYFFEKIKF